MMTKTRVLLADDHTITREGTRMLLANEDDLEIVGEAVDGEEAVELTQQLRPDVLLLDISMPKVNGVQVAQQLSQNSPDVRIVVLTGYDNEQYARALVRLGVRGYLPKSASSRDLVDALRVVARGGVHYQSASEPSPFGRPGGAPDETPTPREMAVLRLVAQGLRNRDIAQRLSTSERTVQFHLANLFAKLSASSRTELVHLARQRGMIY
jgi:DNA-binding NarL/FixJ family response regulator